MHFYSKNPEENSNGSIKKREEKIIINKRSSITPKPETKLRIKSRKEFFIEKEDSRLTIDPN